MNLWNKLICTEWSLHIDKFHSWHELRNTYATSKMNVEAIEEASSCLQKVADNVKELVESENGIATILNDHRSYLADPTIPIYAKLLSKHSMTNTKELEKIMKKQAYFFGERGK